MKEIIKKKMEVGIFAVEVHVSYVLQQCGGTGPGKMNNKVVKCLCNLCTFSQYCICLYYSQKSAF